MFWRGALFSILLFGGVASAVADAIEDIRVWPAPDETRVVLDLDTRPNYKFFTLTSPNRLVVDLTVSENQLKLPKTFKDSPILKKVRTSASPNRKTKRLVFELASRSAPRIFALQPSGDFGHRLVIDLPHNNKPHIDIPIKTRIEKKQPAVAPMSSTALIVVAIDPGHGGTDPGALGSRRGKKRNYEKEVTLPIAKKLAAKINATHGFKAVLTRDADYFVDLNKRSEIARKHGAHLLVSIHADGFHHPKPRGGSVWVLNEGRAKNEMSRWIENHEQQSNLLGGGGVLLQDNKDEQLSKVVLDLLKRNSQRESHEIAAQVLKHMGRVIHLHKDEPAEASLAVLKSPDIPSLLVEAGFMSNPQEEKLLLTSSHQNKVAQAVYQGVVNYFRKFPPDGTLLASRKKLPSVKSQATKRSSAKSGELKVYTVKSGDFLGEIASKYGVSVSSIRSVNGLRSDELRIGQRLKIQAPVSKTIRHQVKRGEYLGKIAGDYDVSINQLREVNRLRSDELRVGQTLIIPGN